MYFSLIHSTKTIKTQISFGGASIRGKIGQQTASNFKDKTPTLSTR